MRKFVFTIIVKLLQQLLIEEDNPQAVQSLGELAKMFMDTRGAEPVEFMVGWDGRIRPITVDFDLEAVINKRAYADVWGVMEIKHHAYNKMGFDITDEECLQVLRDIEQGYDANDGINWTVLEYHINTARRRREIHDGVFVEQVHPITKQVSFLNISDPVGLIGGTEEEE